MRHQNIFDNSQPMCDQSATSPLHFQEDSLCDNAGFAEFEVFHQSLVQFKRGSAMSLLTIMKRAETAQDPVAAYCSDVSEWLFSSTVQPLQISTLTVGSMGNSKEIERG